ncbi:MAG: hypothetical protein HUU55_01340 [Myxococcales bacterium]|nr:hypothetical protein [Myxococcales bacterium]
MIHLNRTVTVNTFDVQGTVARGQDRPEFLAVACLAADLDRPIDGRDITRQLLGSLPEAIGWRVLDRAVTMGLLEWDPAARVATLSESGRFMLEQGQVLVPEEGVWRFYFVDDPLIDNPVIHVERIETPNAKEERDKVYKRDRSNPPAQGAPIPRLITDSIGSASLSLVTQNGFELRELGKEGAMGSTSKLQLSLEWERDKLPVVSLKGSLGKPDEQSAMNVEQRLPMPNELASMIYEQCWIWLVSNATGISERELADRVSHAKRPVVPTAFANQAVESLSSQRTNLAVPSGKLGILGIFDKTTLRDLELVPRTPDDAQQWAEWLQWESLDRYVVPQSIVDLSATVDQRFPFHVVQLPDHSKLTRRALSQPRDKTARFLLTPYDLGLWS